MYRSRRCWFKALNPVITFQGYSRKGAALHGLKKFAEAEKAYEAGLKIEPENAQLKKGLEEVERDASAGMAGMGNMFGLFLAFAAVIRPFPFNRLTCNHLSPFQETCLART